MPLEQHPSSERRPPLVLAAFSGLCPRCSEKTLFVHVAHFDEKCAACDLDYKGFNVGDGPAAFLTLFVGTIIMILAVAVDFAAHPPFWVHMLLWIPLTIAMVAVNLRVAKGILLHLEYRRSAGESRGEEGQ